MTLFDPVGRQVFSPRRARMLRDLLIVSLVAETYLVAVVVIEANRGNTGNAVSVGVPTFTLIGYTIASLIQLRHRKRAAKLVTAMTGGLLVVVGLVLVQTLFGLVPIALGVAVLLLSLRRDENAR